MKPETRRPENMTMRALYLIAIVFVVDGHTCFEDMFDMRGLFSYYSFHLMLFAFASGYLLRDSDTAQPLHLLARKARRLLVPLYAWNLVYGLGAALLRRIGGFALGEPLSAYTLLLAPLTDGEHFVWNLGSWFVFPLFLAQALYLLARRLSRLWGEREPLTFLLCLIPGAIAVELCAAGHNSPLFLMRSLILLPGIAGGVLYRRCLEKHDNLPTVPYLLALVVARVLLFMRYDHLAYLLSKCTYFDSGAVGVYLGGAIAVAFWLRIARLLAPHLRKSRLALALSRHTFDVMMHHYIGLSLVNLVFLAVHMLGLGAKKFSIARLRTEYGYLYAPPGRQEWNALYLLAGLLVPLLIGGAVRWLGARIKPVCARVQARMHQARRC